MHKNKSKLNVSNGITNHYNIKQDKTDLSDWEYLDYKCFYGKELKIGDSYITDKKIRTNSDNKVLTETSDSDYEIIPDEWSVQFTRTPTQLNNKRPKKSGQTNEHRHSVNGPLEKGISLIYYLVTIVEIIAVIICGFFIKIKHAIGSLIISDRSKRKRARITQRQIIQQTNNSAYFSNDQEKDDSIILFIYMLASVGVIVFFLSYCWSHSDSQMCSIQYLSKIAKNKMIHVGYEIYRLPGEDCMNADRCCNGVLEALFRWITCLLTIQFRASLTAIPYVQNKVQPESIDNIRVMIDKILEELNDVRERANKLEKLLLKLRHQHTDLEKIIREKSNEVVKIDPRIKSYGNKLKKIHESVLAHRTRIKNVIFIKDNVDKIVENMKKVARDLSTQVKSSVTTLKSISENEAHKLVTKLDILETMIKEDEQRIRETNDGHLIKAKSEMEHIRTMQDDIRQRLYVVSNLPNRYKEVSQRMKEDIKNKMQYDLDFHETLAKKTECFCMDNLDQFKTKLNDVKKVLTCFLEKTVDDKMIEMESEIKEELTRNFYERTVEIAKEVTQDAMLKTARVKKIHDPNVLDKHAPKGAGLMRDRASFKFKTDKPQNIFLENNQCNKDDYEDQKQCDASLTNITSFGINTDNLTKKSNNTNKCLVYEEIYDMVKEAFFLYATGDKIGIIDYALESMGGKVLPHYSSPTYNTKLRISAKAPAKKPFFYSFFNFESDAEKNNALYHTTTLRNLINPSTRPGDCWSFAGSQGHAVVVLSKYIYVNAVSIDHISASISLTGDISLAPRNFTVSTFPASSSEESVVLGSFEYIHDMKLVQTFWIKNPVPAYAVKLSIISNHGNKEYTCIYRFRVHGTLVDP